MVLGHLPEFIATHPVQSRIADVATVILLS
jgi:hypothetical protein